MQLFIEDEDARQKYVDGLQEKIEELEKAYKKARLSKKAQWSIVGLLFIGTVRFHHPPNHQLQANHLPITNHTHALNY
jgi:predicted AlkP superfamily phosphohydrolase/phosphomutase